VDYIERVYKYPSLSATLYDPVAERVQYDALERLEELLVESKTFSGDALDIHLQAPNAGCELTFSYHDYYCWALSRRV